MRDAMYNVLVLMSTFNGEKWITDQISSIFNQKDINISLLVRDDGSTDSTITLLNKLRKSYNISLLPGKNIGPANSYLLLCQAAEKMIDLSSIDFIAFSDQDDIWLPSKLSISCKTIINSSAELYICSLDAFSTDMGDHKYIYSKHLCFIESLIRDFGSGCSMLFSKKLLHTINSYSPKRIIMHDIWLTQVCSALNYKIVVDASPLVRYRQHSDNVCGVPLTFKSKIKAHIINLITPPSLTAQDIANELLVGYSNELCIDHKKILKIIANKKTISRKVNIIKYSIHEHFSNNYRKLIFLIQVLLGKQ